MSDKKSDLEFHKVTVKSFFAQLRHFKLKRFLKSYPLTLKQTFMIVFYIALFIGFLIFLIKVAPDIGQVLGDLLTALSNQLAISSYPLLLLIACLCFLLQWGLSIPVFFHSEYNRLYALDAKKVYVPLRKELMSLNGNFADYQAVKKQLNQEKKSSYFILSFLTSLFTILCFLSYSIIVKAYPPIANQSIYGVRLKASAYLWALVPAGMNLIYFLLYNQYFVSKQVKKFLWIQPLYSSLAIYLATGLIGYGVVIYMTINAVFSFMRLLVRAWIRQRVERHYHSPDYLQQYKELAIKQVKKSGSAYRN